MKQFAAYFRVLYHSVVWGHWLGKYHYVTLFTLKFSVMDQRLLLGISTCSLSFDSDVNNYYARFSYQNIMYAFYGYKGYW